MSGILAMIRARTPASVVRLAWLLASFALSSSPNWVRSETDPKAQALLEAVIKVHRDLPAYADRGEFLLEMNVRGKSTKQAIPISIAMTRPDKIRIETPLATLVTDGKILTSSLKPLKKFTVTPAPRALNFATLFTEGPVGSAIFGGPGGPPLQIPLNLLLAADPSKVILGLGQELKLAPDIIIDGKTINVLRIESGDEPAYQVAIDPETKLLRYVEIVREAWNPKETIPGTDDVNILAFRWTPGEITTKPADDATFVFTPPADFKKVDELTEDDAKAGADGGKGGGAAAAKPETIEEWIGKPSPEFRLALLDGKDATKNVSKADLAGKVVVINFWATWCVPCMNELPDIQKLIKACAAAKKDVVVVALSQDEAGDDPASLRTLVESTLRDRKINLTATPFGKVGLDPSGAIAQSFRVAGLPSTVVLDRDGFVRSVHVGFEPKIGESLLKEIDGLLTAKPN